MGKFSVVNLFTVYTVTSLKVLLKILIAWLCGAIYFAVCIMAVGNFFWRGMGGGGALQCCPLLKSHTLDICRHNFGRRLLHANAVRKKRHSGVKFVCMRISRFRTWVRHWSLCRKIRIISLAHTQRSSAIAQTPYGAARRTPIPMRTCQGATNNIRWLACVPTLLRARHEFWLVHFVRMFAPL